MRRDAEVRIQTFEDLPPPTKINLLQLCKREDTIHSEERHLASTSATVLLLDVVVGGLC